MTSSRGLVIAKPMKIPAAPVQFDFGEKWHTDILPHRKNPLLEDGFGHVRGVFEEVAQWIYDDAEENSHWFDRELAEMELMLNLHIASVQCFCLDWLQKNLEADQLAPLSLAIAEEFYPEKNWFILEDGTEAIVTDEDRTMVFDLINYDKLSAAASLALVGDKAFHTSEFALSEALNFREGRIQEEVARLETMQSLLKTEAGSTGLRLVVNQSAEDLD